ncbi:MAG: uncharacterized protein JWO65_1135, partial [Sphingomonas bacterium]|nr:uncharacterized protein [Sphingomonas bacterium]
EIDWDRINKVLMPYATDAHARIENGTRFVHYTSAKSALEILQSQCLWMRNATCMNDYNEMRHGLRCLVEAFQTDAGAAFNAALEACYPDLSKELDGKFTAVAPSLIEHTYIACISEHSDDEELYGRLSMWRAYGSSTGVALVFNNGPFVRPSDAHFIWTTPVAYIDAQGVRGQIQKIADQMVVERDLLKTLSREVLLDALFRTLIFAVVSSKHEGFKEEREWRVVHLPTIWPTNVDRLPLEQVALGGVPQPIFKIPMVDYPDDGFYGATIPDLINRVIIGPTQYPSATRTALAQVLGKAGVQNPLDRVHCSDVTLRVT